MKGKEEKSEHSTIRCFVALTRSQQRFETLVDAILGNNILLGVLLYMHQRGLILCI